MDSTKKLKIRSLAAKEIAAKRPKAGVHGKSKKARAKSERKAVKRENNA